MTDPKQTYKLQALSIHATLVARGVPVSLHDVQDALAVALGQHDANALNAALKRLAAQDAENAEPARAQP